LADRSTVALWAHAEDISAAASEKFAPNVASDIKPPGAARGFGITGRTMQAGFIAAGPPLPTNQRTIALSSDIGLRRDLGAMIWPLRCNHS
jgi:hypothetical protein